MMEAIFLIKKDELASQIMLKVVLCLELPFTFTISNENETVFQVVSCLIRLL